MVGRKPQGRHAVADMDQVALRLRPQHPGRKAGQGLADQAGHQEVRGLVAAIGQAQPRRDGGQAQPRARQAQDMGAHQRRQPVGIPRALGRVGVEHPVRFAQFRQRSGADDRGRVVQLPQGVQKDPQRRDIGGGRVFQVRQVVPRGGPRAGGQVEDPPGTGAGHHRGDCGGVQRMGADQADAVRDIRQPPGDAAGAGQHGDLLSSCHAVAHEMRADEARPPRDQHPRHGLTLRRRRRSGGREAAR